MPFLENPVLVVNARYPLAIPTQAYERNQLVLGNSF
jgi:hypothetical protein